MHREAVTFAFSAPRPQSWEEVAHIAARAAVYAGKYGIQDSLCARLDRDPEWWSRAPKHMRERIAMRNDPNIAVLIEGWTLKE